MDSVRVPLLQSFLRYNMSAGVATATDFTTLFICKEYLGIDPVLGTFIGATFGATVAFILGRNWTFMSQDGKVSTQTIKFVLVVAGSILLNTFGEYLLTKVFVVGHYMLARIITAMIVGALYNFPLQRYFVFKK